VTTPEDFRDWRQKRVTRQKPLQLKAGWICFLLCAIIFSADVWRTHSFRDNAAAPTFPETATPTFPEAAISFTSSNPEGAVTIPFVLHLDGCIVVSARFNQQIIPSFLDTGTRDIRANIPIQGSSLIKTISAPVSTGAFVPANFVSVPVIQMKEFCLNHVPVVSFDSAYIPASCNAILGIYTFKNVTLTIDYAKRTLTLYPTSYDVSKRKHRPQDILLDLNFCGDAIAYSPEFLTVHGKLEGQEVDFVLDTGNVSDGILMSPRLRLKLKSVPVGSPPTQQYVMAGHNSLEFTRPLHWNLGQAEGNLPGVTIEMRKDWDALIGYQFLKNYRVTIDYPHRKLLLEPNDPSVVGKKMQNAFPAGIPASIRTVLPPIPDGYCMTIEGDKILYFPCPKGELNGTALTNKAASKENRPENSNMKSH